MRKPVNQVEVTKNTVYFKADEVVRLQEIVFRNNVLVVQSVGWLGNKLKGEVVDSFLVKRLVHENISLNNGNAVRWRK